MTRRSGIAACLICLWLVAGECRGMDETGAAQAPPDSLVALFRYDAKAPLDLQSMGDARLIEGVILLQPVSYASPVAARVSAYIVAPRTSPLGGGIGPKPCAGIVFMHWGQGDRSEFVSEAIIYARSGAVSILVDAPWARPEPWTQPGERIDQPEATRMMYIQNVVDLRRAIDVLLARGDVDSARLAFVGHSFGATWGGVLGAVEKRLKTMVLMGGLPSPVDFSLRGAPNFDWYAEYIEKRLPKDALIRYVGMIDGMSSKHLARYIAPASVLMQFGTCDSWISRKAAEVYYAAASEPKEARWYTTSHEFNDPVSFADRARWLQRELRLAPIVPIAGSAVTGR